MTLPIEAADERSGVRPSFARMRDYWLGGQHYREVDRDFAERTSLVAPHIPYLVRAQRALLGRMVRYLVGQGVRQFLDLGSGLPTLGHVHQIAQELEPAARVVYVDNDPSIVADSRHLLDGNDNAVLLGADVRAPEDLLANPCARRLLDLREPLALFVIATLQDIPDSDEPAKLIARYMDALSPGSYLAISHYGPDNHLAAAYELFDQMRFGKRPDVILRDSGTLYAYFAGLELVEPGVVPIALWRPDPDDDLGRNSERAPVYAGVGRKS